MKTASWLGGLTVLLGLAVFAPHFVWLIQNDWLPLTYASSRASSQRLPDSLAGRASRPASVASRPIRHWRPKSNRLTSSGNAGPA